MEKICLDFDTAMDFLRGDASTIEKLRYYADREEICITSFTLLHLLQIINRPEVVSAFANSITVLPFDNRAAKIASAISRELEERGDGDKRMEGVLMASICIANGAYLYSKSTVKYDGIKGLKKV